MGDQSFSTRKVHHVKLVVEHFLALGDYADFRAVYERREDYQQGHAPNYAQTFELNMVTKYRMRPVSDIRYTLPQKLSRFLR